MSEYIDITSSVSPEIIEGLANSIKHDATRHIRIMEVCGTHTMSIAKNGIRGILPNEIELISGPGCPVCVAPTGAIDACIAVAENKDMLLVTFGDMIRVPGSQKTLQQTRSEGGNVAVVYSPLDALNLAISNPQKEIVFAGIGFETTVPIVAATIKRAKEQDIKNFSVLCMHKNVPHVLKALVNDSEVGVDAFILPGHVSTIIGSKPYEFLAQQYHVPGVIAGFEVIDILQAIAMIVKQLADDNSKIEIAYLRGVSKDGNTKAIAIMNEVFEEADSVWRGLGNIALSGFSIRKEYANYCAQYKFGIEFANVADPAGCRCADVLRGVIRPSECPLFGRVCNSVNPAGPCMVSSEGSCAAWHRYGLK